MSKSFKMAIEIGNTCNSLEANEVLYKLDQFFATGKKRHFTFFPEIEAQKKYPFLTIQKKELRIFKKLVKKKYGSSIKIKNFVFPELEFGEIFRGSHLEKIILHCSTKLFPLRFIDDNFEEIVNIESFCYKYLKPLKWDLKEIEQYKKNSKKIEICTDNPDCHLHFFNATAFSQTEYKFITSNTSKKNEIVLIIRFKFVGDFTKYNKNTWSREYAFSIENVKTKKLSKIINPKSKLIVELIKKGKFDKYQELKEQLKKSQESLKNEVIEQLKIMVNNTKEGKKQEKLLTDFKAINLSFPTKFINQK